MNNFLSFIVHVLFQALTYVGLWLFIQPAAWGMVKQYSSSRSRRMEFKQRLFKDRKGKHVGGSGFQRHLEQMMMLTKSDYAKDTSYLRFLLGTSLLAAATFIIAFFTIGQVPGQLTNNPFNISVQDQAGATADLRIAIILSLISLTVPYLNLRYKYMMASAKSSYDLKEAALIMAKFANLSVDRAISQTAKLLPDSNVLRQPLLELSAVFISYRDEEQLLKETKRFAGMIGTTFAAQFINNLVYAEREGNANMKSDFLFLHEAMERQEETIIGVKANARDAVQIGIIVNLFTFFVLTGSLIFFMRPSIYFKFQLETTFGLTILLMIIVSFLFSVVFSIALSRPRLDY